MWDTETRLRRRTQLTAVVLKVEVSSQHSVCAVFLSARPSNTTRQVGSQ